MDALFARYVALSPHLREDWDYWRKGRGSSANAHTFFCALTSHFDKLLAAGNRSAFGAIFAEVERSMLSTDRDESNAAAVCFLENISNGRPEAYAWILPHLGPESLKFLRAWESGEASSFMSVAEARDLVVGPLSAACPAFARAYHRAWCAISTEDDQTTAFGIAWVAFDFLVDASVEEAGAMLAAIEPFLASTRRQLRRAFRRCFLDRLGELPAAWVASRASLLGAEARAYHAKVYDGEREVPSYCEHLRPRMAAPSPEVEAIVARYVAVSPSVRREWDEARTNRDAVTACTFFGALAIHVGRLLEAGQHANLPAIFAEVERSMSDGDHEEGEAAATCFLESLSNGWQRAYVRILPLLGPASLAYLRQWEHGERTAFLSAEEARALVIDPLAAACPSFACAWERGRSSVSAEDGGTTSVGVAWVAFDFWLTASDEEASALLAAIERLLVIEQRDLATAFRRYFLDRLAELPLARLRTMRERLGPSPRSGRKMLGAIALVLRDA